MESPNSFYEDVASVGEMHPSTFSRIMPSTKIFGVKRNMSWSERIRKSSSRRLTYTEKLTLSPLAKFRQFGRFPWKLILHLIVVALSTSFILLHSYEFSTFIQANERSFRSALQHDPNPNPQGNTIIFSVDTLVDHLQTSSSSYFKYHDHTIGEVQTSPSISMRFDYWNGSSSMIPISAAAPIGPFDATIEDNRQLVDALRYITIPYHFQNRLGALTDPFGPYQSVDFSWTCTGRYSDLLASARLNPSLTMPQLFVPSRYDFSDDAETVFHLSIASKLSGGQGITKLIAIDCVTICICILSSALGVRALLRSRDVYLYAKKRLCNPRPSINNGRKSKEEEITWDSLSWKDHLAFFNLWHVVTITGDILLIVGCFLGLSKQFRQSETALHYMTAEQIFRSFGIFLEWFSLVKYMEFDIEFYMLIVAVRASLMRVTKFVIMTTPMYLGYMFIGMHLFSSHSDYFGDVQTSARTLFALLNGDSVLLVYQTLCLVDDEGYCIFGQLYLYTFCMTFIVVILNVFIFIIETGYEKAQLATTSQTDENPVMLDHERIRLILEAADRAAGIRLSDLDHEHDEHSDSDDDDLLVASREDPLRDRSNSFVHDWDGILGHPKRGRITLTANEVESLIDKAVARSAERLEARGIQGTRIVDQSTDYEMTVASLEAARKQLEALEHKLQEDQDAHVSLREALQKEFTAEIVRLTERNVELEQALSDARAANAALLVEVTNKTKIKQSERPC